MRRASLLVLFLLLPSFALLGGEESSLEAAEKALGPKAERLRELMVGAPLSDRKRDNKVKRYAEALAWDPKALEKALSEHKEKARDACRRERKKAMEDALGKLVGNAEAAEGLVRQAEKAQDKAPKGLDPGARLRWMKQQGLTRPGSAEAAAPYVFADEDFVPVTEETYQYLQGLGFDRRDAEILVFELELGDQIRLRLDAARAK